MGLMLVVVVAVVMVVVVVDSSVELMVVMSMVVAVEVVEPDQVMVLQQMTEDMADYLQHVVVVTEHCHLS